MKKLFVLVAILGMGAYLAGCGGDEPKPAKTGGATSGMGGPPAGGATPGPKATTKTDGDKDDKDMDDDKDAKADGDKDDGDADKKDDDAKEEN